MKGPSVANLALALLRCFRIVLTSPSLVVLWGLALFLALLLSLVTNAQSVISPLRQAGASATPTVTASIPPDLRQDLPQDLLTNVRSATSTRQTGASAPPTVTASKNVISATSSRHTVASATPSVTACNHQLVSAHLFGFVGGVAAVEHRH